MKTEPIWKAWLPNTGRNYSPGSNRYPDDAEDLVQEAFVGFGVCTAIRVKFHQGWFTVQSALRLGESLDRRIREKEFAINFLSLCAQPRKSGARWLYACDPISKQKRLLLSGLVGTYFAIARTLDLSWQLPLDIVTLWTS